MKKLKRATKHIKIAARRLKKAHKIKQINWTALLKHRDKTKDTLAHIVDLSNNCNGFDDRI